MLPIPGRYLSIGALLLFFGWVLFLREPRGGDFDASSMRMVVRQLNAANSDTRRRAAEHILKHAGEAIPLLEQIALHDESQREIAMSCLSDIVVSHDDDVGEEASDAIEKCLHSGDEYLAEMAWQTVSENILLRKRRAIRNIEQLGGLVKAIHSPLLMGGSAFEFAVIGPDWKGTSEDLKYFRRLTTLNILYLDDSYTLSDIDRQQLLTWYPRLHISRSSEGCLGLISSEDPRGVLRIDAVVPGSPASRIGLRVGDQILRIGHHENPSLIDLLAETSRSMPGALIELKIARRSLQTILYQVRIGSDFGVGMCQCQAVADFPETVTAGLSPVPEPESAPPPLSFE